MARRTLQDRCRQVIRDEANLYETFIYDIAGCNAVEPHHNMQQWSSPTKPCCKLQDGHPSVHGVQRTNAQHYSTKHTPTAFACTECCCPHNIEDCTAVKEAVKCYHSNNLKKMIIKAKRSALRQDSEHEDERTKSDDEHSEYEEGEETYAQYNGTQCIKCAFKFRLPIDYPLCHGNTPLRQECNNYQQFKCQRF